MGRTKNTKVSEAVRILYSFINEGMPERGSITNPNTGRKIRTDLHFGAGISERSPDKIGITRYIENKELPAGLKSIFTYQENPLKNIELNPGNVHVVYKNPIDADELDSVIEREKPGVEPRKESTRREYYKGGEKILQMNKMLVKLIFFPMEDEPSGRTIYTPHEEALWIADKIHGDGIYLKDVKPWKTYLDRNGEIRSKNH